MSPALAHASAFCRALVDSDEEEELPTTILEQIPFTVASSDLQKLEKFVEHGWIPWSVSALKLGNFLQVDGLTDAVQQEMQLESNKHHAQAALQSGVVSKAFVRGVFAAPKLLRPFPHHDIDRKFCQWMHAVRELSACGSLAGTFPSHHVSLVSASHVVRVPLAREKEKVVSVTLCSFCAWVALGNRAMVERLLLYFHNIDRKLKLRILRIAAQNASTTALARFAIWLMETPAMQDASRVLLFDVPCTPVPMLTCLTQSAFWAPTRLKRVVEWSWSKSIRDEDLLLKFAEVCQPKNITSSVLRQWSSRGFGRLLRLCNAAPQYESVHCHVIAFAPQPVVDAWWSEFHGDAHAYLILDDFVAVRKLVESTRAANFVLHHVRMNLYQIKSWLFVARSTAVGVVLLRHVRQQVLDGTRSVKSLLWMIREASHFVATSDMKEEIRRCVDCVLAEPLENLSVDDLCIYQSRSDASFMGTFWRCFPATEPMKKLLDLNGHLQYAVTESWDGVIDAILGLPLEYGVLVAKKFTSGLYVNTMNSTKRRNAHLSKNFDVHLHKEVDVVMEGLRKPNKRRRT